MVFISKEGDVIKAGADVQGAIDLYDSWTLGKNEFLLNTSGSTGLPKKIKVSREAITASIKSTQNYFNLNNEDLFLCNLNTDFIGGKMMVLRAAEIGCDIVVIPASANPFEDLENQKYLFSNNWGKNFFSFVPMQLQNLLLEEHNIQLLRTAKAILVGGGAVSSVAIKSIKKHYLPVYETYGMTETISHIALRDLREENPAFTVLEGVEIDADADSCLKIKAPSTLNRWITTNDIVDIINEKEFLLRGRKDNVINSGGIKIQLEEVDKALHEVIPDEFKYFSYGINDALYGQKLILVIESDEKSLKLNFDNLPKYHKPKDVFIIPEFKHTPSGKIDKIKTANLISK